MQNRSVFTGLIAIILLFILNSCSVTTPTLPLPDLVTGEWTQLAGSTETVCANGSEFNYFGYDTVAKIKKQPLKA